MGFGVVLAKNIRKLRFDVRYSLPEDKQMSKIECAVAILDKDAVYAGPQNQCLQMSGNHIIGVNDYSSDDRTSGDGTTGITINISEIEEKFSDVRIISIVAFQIDDEFQKDDKSFNVGDAKISIDVHAGVEELVRDAHMELTQGNAFEAIELIKVGEKIGGYWMINFEPNEFVHNGWKFIKNMYLK